MVGRFSSKFSKYDFPKIRRLGAELLHTDGQTAGKEERRDKFCSCFSQIRWLVLQISSFFIQNKIYLYFKTQTARIQLFFTHVRLRNNAEFLDAYTKQSFIICLPVCFSVVPFGWNNSSLTVRTSIKFCIGDFHKI